MDKTNALKRCEKLLTYYWKPDPKVETITLRINATISEFPSDIDELKVIPMLPFVNVRHALISVLKMQTNGAFECLIREYHDDYASEWDAVLTPSQNMLGHEFANNIVAWTNTNDIIGIHKPLQKNRYVDIASAPILYDNGSLDDYEFSCMKCKSQNILNSCCENCEQRLIFPTNAFVDDVGGCSIDPYQKTIRVTLSHGYNSNRGSISPVLFRSHNYLKNLLMSCEIDANVSRLVPIPTSNPDEYCNFDFIDTRMIKKLIICDSIPLLPISATNYSYHHGVLEHGKGIVVPVFIMVHKTDTFTGPPLRINDEDDNESETPEDNSKLTDIGITKVGECDTSLKECRIHGADDNFESQPSKYCKMNIN